MAAVTEMRSCVRGYHVYKSIWTPVIGKELQCMRDVGNVIDRYAVGVYKNNILVGHVPQKISTLSLLFLRRGGLITCRITGRRRRSIDLPQGGLEIPCILVYRGTEKEIQKLLKIYRKR